MRKNEKVTTIDTYNTAIEIDESACQETKITERLKFCTKSNLRAPGNSANFIVISLPLTYILFLVYLE